MDIYVSNYTNRLDAKGRVSIPAPFRAVLARDGFEGLYVHPSLDQEALDCGGHALLREIDGLLSGYTPYSEERDLLSLALMGSSEILKVDSEGRVDPDRNAEVLRGRLQRSHLRRRRPQVSDLGVWSFSRAHGGGQNPGARFAETASVQTRGAGRSAAAITWSTGMNAGRGDEDHLAAGGPARHIPVLRDEVLAVAGAARRRPLSRRHLRRRRLFARDSGDAQARACSRSTAIPTPSPRARRSPPRRTGGCFWSRRASRSSTRVAQRLHLGGFDAVVLDIGVSSMQLDDSARGFSFRGDGPLDMRMEQTGRSAADIVNTADEATLADILYHFGEERASRAHRPRHRRRSRQRALRHDAALAEHDRARRAGKPGRASIRRRAPFRRCASPSTTNSANCSRRSPPPKRF